MGQGRGVQSHPPCKPKGSPSVHHGTCWGCYEDREVQQVLELREGVTSPSCLALLLNFPYSNEGMQPTGWGGIPAGPQQSQLRAVLRNSSSTRRTLSLPWLCPLPSKAPMGSHGPPADPTCLWHPPPEPVLGHCHHPVPAPSCCRRADADLFSPWWRMTRQKEGKPSCSGREKAS